MKKIVKSEAQWQRCLSPEEYAVLREKGTEHPNTGKFVHWDEDGLFKCKACGNVLFDSQTKFDSGTGWPSFSDVASSDAVELRPDKSWFGEQTEVICKKCGSHLGHVFDDGPTPTGKRYCINSVALGFEKNSTEERVKKGKSQNSVKTKTAPKKSTEKSSANKHKSKGAN